MLAENVNAAPSAKGTAPITLAPLEPMFTIVNGKLKRSKFVVDEFVFMKAPMIVADDNYHLLTMIEAPDDGWDNKTVESTLLPNESSVVFIGSVMIGSN